jgi:hypothetical protein
MRPSPMRRSQGENAPRANTAITSVNSHFSTTVTPSECLSDYNGAPAAFD